MSYAIYDKFEEEELPVTLQQIEQELIELPATERLRRARWLLDTLLDNQSNNLLQTGNPLLNVAGRFHGGPGDSAEHSEEILANEVNPRDGFSRQ